MNKKLLLCVLCLIFFSAAISFSAPLIFKIGSTAPSNSPWDKALKKIAADWKQITGGQVQMKIYPNSIAGDEPDMIRKMRFNSLQGATLSSIGLNMIATDVMSLSVPFIIRNDDEFDYVLSKIQPMLLEKMEKQGFKLIAWTMVGWVYFFSKEEVSNPSELKRLKLAAGESNPANEQAWKALGFDIIQVPLHEVLPALNSGMIEACYIVPLAAAAYQWFGVANHMMDMPISPVLGGIVVSERAWNRVPDRYKEDLLQSAEEAADQLYYDTLALEKDAMKIMLENGLITNPVTETEKEQWRNAFMEGFDLVVGKSFSKEIYEAILKHLEDYRKKYGG